MDNPKRLATYDAQDEQKTKQNTICIGHHYTQTNTNNINKALAILQTTSGKDKPNIVYGHHSTKLRTYDFDF
jgi:hypothetical protein